MSALETKTTTTYYVGQRSDQLFGFDARYIRESSTFEKFTEIPSTRPELVGVVNLRNTVLPILLPDRWLLTEPAPYDPQKPVAVIDFQKTTFAIQLDAIHGVQTAQEANHHPHPYQAETGYFSNLVTLEDGTIFTAISVKDFINQIKNLTV
ncbi:MAG: chemotaxis protein CheW [Verrucomicrobiota bacterium]